MHEGLIARVIARMPSLPVPEWDAARVFCDAIRPRERISVCEWVERNIYLSPDQSSMPGRVSLERTPYLREILECANDDDVEEVTTVAGTQSGKTSVLQFSMAYLADEQPGPAMWVAPIANLAREISEERMAPVFRDSPTLSRLIPDSKRAIKATRFRLTTCTIHFAWATSASELASRPKRYLYFDETDKYPIDLGKEGNPIALGKERQRTFWSKKLYRASTPTDHRGDIWRSYQRSSREKFLVPCPHCGHRQHLVFPQIKWPSAEGQTKEATAAEIKTGRLAWYECAECKGRIEEAQRMTMVARGSWCPEGCEVDSDGAIIGGRPKFSHRGFWWNALYSPWLTFSDIAAEFLECQADPEKYQNFVNSWLAELWVQASVKLIDSRMEDVKRQYFRGDIPHADVVLTTGVDVQKGHIYFVVRAWAENMESWLIDWGKLSTQGEYMGDMISFDHAVLQRDWRTMDNRRVDVVGGFIDSKYRGDEVFGWLRAQRPCMRASQGNHKGMSKPLIEEHWDPKKRGINTKHGLSYWHIDTGYFKRWISNMFASDAPGWHVPQDVDDDYVKQFFSEHEVAVKGVRGARGEKVWEKRPGKTDNHYWDCEVYALAAAFERGIGRGALPTAPPKPGDNTWAREHKRKLAEVRRRRGL